MQISPESLKRLRQFVKEERMDFSECLAVLLVEQDFVLDGSVELDRETLQRKIALFQRKKPKPFGQLILACEKIFLDLVYFPLPKTKGESKFFFEDGYGMARSYGGNRTHEGIDIFGSSKAQLLSGGKYDRWDRGEDRMAAFGRISDRYSQSRRRIFLLCTFVCL